MALVIKFKVIFPFGPFNKFTLIYGIGFVVCTPNIKLSSVLHVPLFPINLLSVNAITKTFNYKIDFFFLTIVFFKTFNQQKGLAMIDCMMTYICCKGILVLPVSSFEK